MKQLQISNMKGSRKEKTVALAQKPTAVTPTEKIRRETKTPTCQELAKDPGPKPPEQQQQQQQQQQKQGQSTKRDTISDRVLKGTYSLKHYAGIAVMAKEGEAGSEVLQAWRKEFPHKFLEPASRYDAPMQHDDPTTWETAAEAIYEFCGRMENFENIYTRVGIAKHWEKNETPLMLQISGISGVFRKQSRAKIQ